MDRSGNNWNGSNFFLKKKEKKCISHVSKDVHLLIYHSKFLECLGNVFSMKEMAQSNPYLTCIEKQVWGCKANNIPFLKYPIHSCVPTHGPLGVGYHSHIDGFAPNIYSNSFATDSSTFPLHLIFGS